MAKVFNLDGTVAGEIKLPSIFSFEYRPDLIQRAVLSIQSHRRQPYGVNTLAGKRTSAHYHGSRSIPYSMMNREMARMARTHSGPPALEFTARTVPQARKGREAHPPKAEKDWNLKINTKEKKVALKSAIAASAMLELVKKRHNVSDVELPIVISNEIQNVKKTKELEKIILTLNLYSDLERAKNRKVRAGKGKMRGRKYKKKKSILFVVNEDKGIFHAAKNIPGVNICLLKDLNVELLAPGTHAGRLTVWDESSIKKLGEIHG